jgi:hypothetical protein
MIVLPDGASDFTGKVAAIAGGSVLSGACARVDGATLVVDKGMLAYGGM